MTQETYDKIVDKIVDVILHNEGDEYITFEDGDLYVTGAIEYDIDSYDNYITVDGRRYFEGHHDTIDGVHSVDVEAWLGEEPIEIDNEYVLYKIQQQY